LNKTKEGARREKKEEGGGKKIKQGRVPVYSNQRDCRKTPNFTNISAKSLFSPYIT